MTNPERIYAFLQRQAPHAFCDDCTAREAGVSPRNQVNPIVSAFGLTRDFDRARGTCHHCKAAKLVTRSATKP